jgi:hypothetical protein
VHVQKKDLDELKFLEIKELYPKVWENLSDTRKVFVMQECSNRICDFENRPRSTVEIVDFKKLGKDWKAAYAYESNTIGISPEYLKSATSYDMFGTLIHESMHGYQFHAINNLGFHKEIEDVKEWKLGHDMYDKMYYFNPIEIHSRSYENSFREVLQHQHQYIRDTQSKNEDYLEEIKIVQISDCKFQVLDNLSGEIKTYEIELPKGKPLNEVIKSHPHLVSEIINLEKGQERSINSGKGLESKPSLEVNTQSINKDSSRKKGYEPEP